MAQKGTPTTGPRTDDQATQGDAPGYADGGLDRRYVVTKRDGTPIDPRAKYFVLRYDRDPHALAALFTYAASVAEDNKPLADQLLAALYADHTDGELARAQGVAVAEEIGDAITGLIVGEAVEADVTRVLNELAFVINANARSHGFWPEGEDRNVAEMIALIHSELSEALEGYRHGNPSDDHVPEFDSLTVELADAVIRILDMAAGMQLDFAAALIAKMRYNLGRPHKHGKEF
jgi:NTP pyrophosphatase (non-canonical NTP hydrolase)